MSLGEDELVVGRIGRILRIEVHHGEEKARHDLRGGHGTCRMSATGSGGCANGIDSELGGDVV